MRTCIAVRDREFCYPEIRLQPLDIIFLIVVSVSLVAIWIGWLQRRLK
jgi:hypothetical protein